MIAPLLKSHLNVLTYINIS